MPGLIESFDCSTAEEFLGLLSPFHPLWLSTGGSTFWRFRGQGDASWELSPSAMRDGAFMHFGIGVSTPLTIKTVTDQLDAEDDAVKAFAIACMKAGLALPEDGQLLRSDAAIRQLVGKDALDQASAGIEFPLPIQRSVYALAQHHRVKTRLLDWTEAPLIAAYFACEGVARWQKDPASFPFDARTDRLAVWALREIAFDYMRELHHRKSLKFDPILESVEAPYRDNPRLAAQKGTFTLVVHKKSTPTTPRLPSIERLLLDYQRVKFGTDGLDVDVSEGPFARKITLPHSQARALLRMLGQAGISIASVIPEYDGAKAAVEEIRFWI